MVSLSATLRLCACLIFAGLPAAAYAQAAPDTARIGSLAGVVVDSMDSGLPDVEVALVRTTFSGVTNAQGAFFIPAIPAVRYLATVTVTRGDRRGLYPELFPIEVLPGQPSGIVIMVSRALLEDSLVFAEMDEDGIASALADIGLQVHAQVRGKVRQGSEPVRVTGVVRDVDTGKGLGNVAVAIEGTPLKRLSDERGHFTFEEVQPGVYSVESTTLGYAARREELIVPGDADLDVQIGLSQKAIELEPILVEARSSGDRSSLRSSKNVVLLRGISTP